MGPPGAATTSGQQVVTLFAISNGTPLSHTESDVSGLSTTFVAPIAGRLVISYSVLFDNDNYDVNCRIVYVWAVINDTVRLVSSVGNVPAGSWSSVSQTLDTGITTVANQAVPVKISVKGGTGCDDVYVMGGFPLENSTMTLMLLAI